MSILAQNDELFGCELQLAADLGICAQRARVGRSWK